jgi:hypothetical protein
LYHLAQALARYGFAAKSDCGPTKTENRLDEKNDCADLHARDGFKSAQDADLHARAAFNIGPTCSKGVE